MVACPRPPGAPRGLAVFVSVCALLMGLAQAQELTPRAVAAPPEDILSGLVRLPDPSEAAVHSRVAWWPMEFATGVQRVEVSAGDALVLAGFGPHSDGWSILVAARDGRPARVEDWVAAGRGRVHQASWPGTPGVRVWELDAPRGGPWTVHVAGPGGGAPGRPDGMLLTASRDGHQHRLTAALSSWDLVPGGRAGLVAELSPGALLDRVRVDVHTPHGELVSFALRDDGVGLDARADGRFSARLPLLSPGRHVAHVQARGHDAWGRVLHRSAWLLLDVPWPGARLGAAVTTQPLADGRLAIDVPVLGLAPGERAHVSAEVWGRGPRGESTPMAWLSRIDAPGDGVEPAVRLVLHPGWLQRAAVTAPFELRNVRLQDVDTHMPRDVLARVDLPAEAWAAAVPIPPVPPPITPAMTLGAPPDDGTGARPASAVGQVYDPTPPKRALLLTHGYCSGPVWPLGDFSGTVLEFLDPNQSRSHDEFAQLLGAFGAQVDSFGIVAHSQGGPASLQLYTYYQSGLDLAQDGRRIQSVGSPYQGSPLAGDIAALGGIFGAGCGPNDDLAPAGSLLWLAGIPSWAREEVHYWTTSTDGLWCLFLSQLLLGNPNDGVVEQSRGQLPGANNMGHVEGWCHTTAMNDPPQVTDTARNLEMDAEAAR